jgi:ribonuclease P protein component
VQRRYRLSRSRDFDTVYRHGRSVSTRYLTLHWFTRVDDGVDAAPRLGLAVPKSVGAAVVRNRVKRQLREAWGNVVDGVTSNCDYVLVARPGLAEAASAHDGAWLAAQVRDAVERMPQ